LGSVLTEEGDTVRVGKIVMDTRHADINLGYTSAALHYDNTGDEVAVVRAGEDNYGVWVAGSIVPEADEGRVAKLRRSPISGDWRRVDGNLELTAALAVNVPAFPVYAMDGASQMALVAAGSLQPEYGELPAQDPGPTGVLDMSLVAAMVRDEIERQERIEDQRARLNDLLDDEGIYEARAKMDRFAMLAAAAVEPVPAPVPVAAGAPQVAAPVAEGAMDEAGMLARQMDAQFSIVEQPAGGPEEPGETAPVPAPVTPAAAPAPAAPVAPTPVG
jgi:hypothetical protein